MKEGTYMKKHFTKISIRRKNTYYYTMPNKLYAGYIRYLYELCILKNTEKSLDLIYSF